MGCVVSLLAGWLIRASIKESVESTIDAVIRIAGGDLETKIESPGKEEISWLRGELNGMRKKLRKMVLEVRQTAEGVNSASSEIASGNIDLSSRTESQASALQHMPARCSSWRSRCVTTPRTPTRHARSSSQSSSVAGRGAQTMQDVASRMGEINASATRIGEIVGVIIGIGSPDQHSAPNAAVEAARAGEHGRGFAVVAFPRCAHWRSAVRRRHARSRYTDR